MEILDNEDISIILTDLQMPNMDGIELIKRVKESGYFKDIPIIVLSSKEGSEDRIKCLRMGADDYIVKPFKNDFFLQKVNEIIAFVR